MTSDFFAALDWLWPIEGGWWDGKRKSDPNPTMYGITERVWKAACVKYGWAERPVQTITKAEATTIYWREYWLAGSCHLMRGAVQLIHFDACVNHGVPNARRLLLRANRDPASYIAARRKFYADIIRNNPDMKPNERGWEKRMRKLEKAVGLV